MKRKLMGLAILVTPPLVVLLAILYFAGWRWALFVLLGTPVALLALYLYWHLIGLMQRGWDMLRDRESPT